MRSIIHLLIRSILTTNNHNPRERRGCPALPFIFSLLLLLAAGREACAQQFAVKTNALFDAALTPDIGVELVTGEHSSVALSVFGHWKPYGINSRMITVQPEYRFWFNGRPLVREYIGATAFASAYDINVKNHVYAGNAVSLGVTGGYVFPLGERMNFELSGGFGFLFFRQKQYLDNMSYDPTMSPVNAYGYKLFPAKLGATFIYIIK